MRNVRGFTFDIDEYAAGVVENAAPERIPAGL
jgi:hypothetical protein